MRTIIGIIILVTLTACNTEESGNVGVTADTAVISNKAYTYTGPVVNGQPEGNGFIKYVWGDVYKGDVVNGLPDGSGVMTYADGSTYSGDWHDGMKHGYGRLQCDTYSYTGNWVSGNKSGQGKLIIDGTTIITGLFRNDEPVEGKVTVEDNSNCISGDCSNGLGTYDDGKRYYVGTFVNGLFEGQGNLKIEGVLEYKGQFKGGQFNGKGTLKNGEFVIQGEFLNGKWLSGIKKYFDGRPDQHLMKGGL